VNLEEGLVTNLPILALEDLLLHKHRHKTTQIQELLLAALHNFGFIILTTPSTSRPARIIQNMRYSIHTQLFPELPKTVASKNKHANHRKENSEQIQKNGIMASNRNVAGLKISDVVYVSEKGVPMYKLGYELCEDRVREIFRVAAGDPDEFKVWPSDNDNSVRTRSTWLQGLGLMRHVTDTALDLLLLSSSATAVDSSHPSVSSLTLPQRKRRPHSGRCAWLQETQTAPQQPRTGDHSVLYAMHYFNEDNNDTEAVAKNHVIYLLSHVHRLV
jgi:hypothetical protein